MFDKNADPNKAREAEKYENPIPSREYLLEVLTNSDHPLSLREFLDTFDIYDEDEAEGIRRRLKAMVRDGQIVRTRRGFGLLERMNVVKGTVVSHRNGFGFLQVDEGGDDWFISPSEMRPLLPGDRVTASLFGIDKRGRHEAHIVEILTDIEQVRLVGRLQTDRDNWLFIPDDASYSGHFMIETESDEILNAGDYVQVQLLRRTRYKKPGLVKVLKALGQTANAELAIEAAILRHAIPTEWPQAVIDSIQSFSEETIQSEAASRVDLRDLPFVTIDGEDAKDFDDAVFCKKTPKGYKLYVAIADVSHYVLPNDALDQLALERGNSVYFPEHVIPMLPEVLSNGLCSLMPNVDRLTMVAEMSINLSGQIGKSTFYPAVIHSHARLTYTQVGSWLEAGAVSDKSFEHIWKPLTRLYDLFQVLLAARDDRGAVEFDRPETRIVLDESHTIQDIREVVRNDAHRLIEECMIAANIASAQFLLKHKMPAVYRNHPGPKDKKLADLQDALADRGLQLTPVMPTPKDINSVLKQASDRPDLDIIELMVLRAMGQANYEPENSGHFGLALPEYTHFTSPIRRYSDLLVHRAIKAILKKQKAEKSGAESGHQYPEATLKDMASHISMTERRADEAVYDVIGFLKCEYMQSHVGEEYTGVISAVTSFGLFVALDDLHVEGLVHITSLENDYYEFDAAAQALTGRKSRKRFDLGQAVKIIVAGASTETRKIDFELVGMGAKKAKKKKRER